MAKRKGMTPNKREHALTDLRFLVRVLRALTRRASEHEALRQTPEYRHATELLTLHGAWP